MLNDSTIQAFTVASGVSPGVLSVFIRTSLISGFFMWSAWCAMELYKNHKGRRDVNIANLIGKYVQIFFLISVVVALVFIH